MCSASSESDWSNQSSLIHSLLFIWLFYTQNIDLRSSSRIDESENFAEYFFNASLTFDLSVPFSEHSESELLRHLVIFNTFCFSLCFLFSNFSIWESFWLFWSFSSCVWALWDFHWFRAFNFKLQVFSESSVTHHCRFSEITSSQGFIFVIFIVSDLSQLSDCSLVKDSLSEWEEALSFQCDLIMISEVLQTSTSSAEIIQFKL